ncbi:uncharacterized protein LOC116234641 isoform X2 [Phasianus colchicus]|uniref:uncharacterized protein LOC116234641 isoform X2 n=1 Tax=Phasianus colchicus TaxID=9054 RepID=UPI00129E5C28|nr:uncharacterized protein LOC116234641 isoform X2 [Phasianus colchicus]
MWLTLLFLVLSLPFYDHEQDLSRRTLQSLQDHSNFLSTEGDEEEISEEAKRLESRFGPQYHNTALQNYSGEQPLNVSDNADLIQGNTAEETSKEDLKETAILAVSSIALAIYLIFLVCFCVAFRKCRMQKGNTCHTFGRSSEQQRSAEGGMNADSSHKKSSDSETVPLMNSVDELFTAVASNRSRTSLSEDSN